jgi:hypothetical protein
MGELVRQQFAGVRIVVPLGEERRHGAVFARAMMLEPDAAHAVGKRQQEIVVIVVAGIEQRIRLSHQPAMGVELLWFCFQKIGPVGEYVEAHRHRAGRIEVDALGVAPGEHGRIHQDFERDLLECRRGAGARCDLERGRELPAVRQPHARLDRDLAREMAGRIKHEAEPLQVQQLGRRDDAALVVVGRREELELDIQVPRAGRNGKVKRVDIDRIAHPFHPLAVGADDEPGEAVDAAYRAVTARTPFRIKQRERAALDRDRLVHAENVARHVARIDLEPDHARVGPVLRRRDGRRQRRRGLGEDDDSSGHCGRQGQVERATPIHAANPPLMQYIRTLAHL